MATLGDLRKRIIAKVSAGTLTKPTIAQIDQQINSTIDYYENRDFWFNEAEASLVTTIGNEVLSGIPADFKDFKKPNALTVIDGDVKYPLISVTPLAFDNFNIESQGLPRYYTYKAGEVRLYFKPDRVYTVKIFYRRTYADLVLDTDTNAFTENADRLIEYKTLEDLLRDYKQDFDRASVYGQKVTDELIQIRKETYDRTATGNLSTENIVGRQHHN